VLEARHAVAARVEEPAVLVDAEGAAGSVGAVEAAEDAVGTEGACVALADDVLGVGGGRERGEAEQEGVRAQDGTQVHEETRGVGAGAGPPKLTAAGPGCASVVPLSGWQHCPSIPGQRAA
jgi:hypothetical protein